MTEGKRTIAVIIQWLGDIIDTELDKSDDQVNMKLVNECEYLINELVKDSVKLSDAQLQRKLAKLKKRASSSTSVKQNGVRKRAKLILLPLCVILIFVSLIGAVSLNAEFREIILAAFNLSSGESTDIDGITYIRGDTTVVYSDIEALLKNESLDILCPQNLTDDIVIEKIYTNGENLFPIQIVFNDSDLKFRVSLNNGLSMNDFDDTSEYMDIHGFTAIINEENNIYRAVIINNMYVYYISHTDKTALIRVLESLS